MIVNCVKVYVKEEHIDDFIRASMKNHTGSVQEPGNLRFDVLQCRTNPSQFLLYEAYESEEASAAFAYSMPIRSSVRRSHSTMSRTSTSAEVAICSPPQNVFCCHAIYQHIGYPLKYLVVNCGNYVFLLTSPIAELRRRWAPLRQLDEVRSRVMNKGSAAPFAAGPPCLCVSWFHSPVVDADVVDQAGEEGIGGPIRSAANL